MALTEFHGHKTERVNDLSGILGICILGILVSSSRNPGILHEGCFWGHRRICALMHVMLTCWVLPTCSSSQLGGCVRVPLTKVLLRRSSQYGA